MPEKPYEPPKATNWWNWRYRTRIPGYEAPVWQIVVVFATFAALILAGFCMSPLNVR